MYDLPDIDDPDPEDVTEWLASDDATDEDDALDALIASYERPQATV